MKKSIVIILAVLATFCLTALGFININDHTDPDLDLVYKVESRFMTRITKEKLYNAQSILDIYPEKATQLIESYKNVKVAILDDDQEIVALGEDDKLNAAQAMLLQSTDYSTDFYVWADCKKKNEATGEWEDDYIVYYMTIVPEKEAAYVNGHDALINYLKENSAEATAIIKQDQLRPGQVRFTITKEATIENVNLDSTSGYPSVDDTLVDLIRNMPGEWDPATNSKGEKVDQELVFFFGLQGC